MTVLVSNRGFRGFFMVHRRIVTPSITTTTTTTTTTKMMMNNSMSSRSNGGISSSSGCCSSPKQILQSIYSTLLRDFIASILCFLFGMHGPTTIVLPYLFNSTNDAGIAIPTMRKIPYQITKAGDVLLDLTLANDYIAKEDATFPSSKLMFISLWMPLSTFICLGLFCPPTIAPRGGGINNNNNHRSNRSTNSLASIHAGTCTLLTAIGISEFITQILKYYVGRLRPNFYSMCNFNTATLTCTNTNIHLIYESRLSFPSGHASLSFCGAGCLVLYFIGRFGYLRNNRHYYSQEEGKCKSKFIFLLSFTPLLLSTYCATSRLVDNWHHPSDILAGMVIGLVCAGISYHIWYPPVTSYYSGIPLSILTLSSSNNMTTEEEGNLPLVNVIEGHFGGARS